MNSRRTLWRQIVEIFSLWIDSVAISLHSLFERFGSHREIKLVENEDDTFTFHVVNGAQQGAIPDHRVHLDNGALRDPLPTAWKAALRNSRVEFVLRATRFLFRPLALPKRATDFLDGIVRAQIDRLTPWSASDAVFHWTPPTDVPNDQIHVTIAATARAAIAPFIRIATEFGATACALEPSAVLSLPLANAPVPQVNEPGRCNPLCGLIGTEVKPAGLVVATSLPSTKKKLPPLVATVEVVVATDEVDRQLSASAGSIAKQTNITAV